MVAIDLWELGYTNEVFSSSLGKRPRLLGLNCMGHTYNP